MCRLPQGLGLISGVPLRFHFKTPVSALVLALDAMPGARSGGLYARLNTSIAALIIPQGAVS